MAVNITAIKTSSSGVWQGDNPLHYAFPLLILQITLILLLTRFLAFLLKPLRQPKVIAEIVGGILLGPSALGRYDPYLSRVFPPWSGPILESVASIGLLFFLFLVGLELDLASIRRSGKRALAIALAGISLPFACGVGVAFVLRRSVDGADRVGYPQFLVFMGVALSITAFPVLARILAELKLLTTRVGETAMAAAAFNDVAAWILLALAVALAGDSDGQSKSPLVSLWVLASGAAFVAVMLAAVKPGMEWVARRCSGDEASVCLTLAGVLVSGFVTDLIGIHAIFGAFVFGLTIPKQGEFADRLIERIEDFVSGLLLPLYFASSGLKTDVAKIRGAGAWGLLLLVVSTACLGKILATFAVAVLVKIPPREALVLGVLMNTKGLVELIVLNIGKEKKVLNDEIFAILVLMALFTTFITTPAVMAVYSKDSPDRRKLRDGPHKEQLRILACVHGPGNAASLIALVEWIRKESPVKLLVMHLVELTERSSSIVMVHRVRRNGLPLFNRLRRAASWHDGAFQAYGQLGRVSVRPSTAVSPLATMHEDVCQAADRKRAALILLPFHPAAWRAVHQRVLRHAPCSVAVLIDRGLGAADAPQRRVCVVFFGGPDDREALELGGRMAEHPAVRVTVLRFVREGGEEEEEGPPQFQVPEKSAQVGYTFSTAKMDRRREEELDEAALGEFRGKWESVAEYVQREAANVVEGVLAVGRGGEYQLMVVGKGRFPSKMVAELAGRQAEHPELGPIGDILGSSSHGVASSVLVIQQHDLAHAHELPVSKVLNPESTITDTDNNAAKQLGDDVV